MNELIELERQGWKALSTEGDAGREFYSSVLREDAVMLLPGGIFINGRENILQSFGSQPWDTFEIENPKVVSLTSNARTLAYRVTAHREGNQPYVAQVSSTYVRDHSWKLVVHQQTPV